MKILPSSIIKELDAYTIANESITSVDLMERAATNCFEWIVQNIDNIYYRPIVIFVGSGNNGGDGLVIARLLADLNPDIQVVLISKHLSEDSQINLQRLEEQELVNISYCENSSQIPHIQPNTLLIDALFGTGLNRPLNNWGAKVVQFINTQKVTVVSIDIPSGLFGEDNSILIAEQKTENVIRATYTLTFEMPFVSFFFAENEKYIGEWIVLPIGLNQEFINRTDSNFFMISEDMIRPLLKKRNKFSHKGTYGHALLIAGSYGKTGAAVLAARACLRSGVGLLTVHVPQSSYTILQIAIPEAMTSLDTDEKVISILPELSVYQSVGIGCGVGKDTKTLAVVEQLLDTIQCPLVLDADALNLISENPHLILKIPENSILTPHPKEFERLVGKFDNQYQRNQQQIEFAKKHKVYLLLKGAYTAIACPDGECYFNSTGNAGMATAGSGDVLTGILTGLLAQGYSSKEAVLLGVYLHGKAGDLAAEVVGQESLLAGDISDYLGKAFGELKNADSQKC